MCMIPDKAQRNATGFYVVVGVSGLIPALDRSDWLTMGCNS